MNKLATLALTFTAMLVAAPAGLASHCSKVTTSKAIYETEDGHYIVADACLGCLPTLWVYEESNGLKGLQRGDLGKDDTCHGRVAADTIVG